MARKTTPPTIDAIVLRLRLLSSYASEGDFEGAQRNLEHVVEN